MSYATIKINERNSLNVHILYGVYNWLKNIYWWFTAKTIPTEEQVSEVSLKYVSWK